MEFEITKILGHPACTPNSFALVLGDQTVTYAACIGAGVAILPVGSMENVVKQQFFYEPPTPCTNSGQSPSSSPLSSPVLRATGGSKLVRVNKSNCVAAAPNSALLAVGEHGGYMPRLLLYNLTSGICQDIISDQHQFGVQFVKFSPSETYLASLGTPQDGFLYIWKVTAGKLSLYCSNKCISEVRDMIWLNNSQLLTVGIRHIKLWTIESDRTLNGRNIVLGNLADETFECALPDVCGEMPEFIVGTSKGRVYKMPNMHALNLDLGKAVKSLALTIDKESNRCLYVSSDSNIYRFDDFSATEPAQIYNFGSSALFAVGSNLFYVQTDKGLTGLQYLSNTDAPASTLETESQSIFRKRGTQVHGCKTSALCWNDEEKFILRWPADLITVSLTDITAADEGTPNSNSLIVGNLSGDIYLGDRKVNAHNGPVTDVHILNQNLCISCGRDRSVQIWTRINTTTPWSLKQTLLFTTPILKARLTANSNGEISLTCCGANKTLYFYKSANQITYGDDGKPAFPDSPRSLMIKAMPFDMTTYGELVVLSSNDKLVSIFNPFEEEKLRLSWRPCDSNGDLVNLTHIGVVKNDSKQVIFGAASNKSVLAFSFPNGDLIASLWGFGEPISGIAWTGNELIGVSDAIIVCRLRPARENPVPPISGVLAKGSHYDLSSPPSHSLPPLSSMSRLNLNASTSPTSPHRKVYVQQRAASTTRSRSVSPVRTATRLPQDAGVNAQASPKILVKDSRESPSKPMNQQLSRLTISKPALKSIPTLANPCHELNIALNAFLNRSLPDSGLQETKQLLISALNKIDHTAMFEQWALRLEKRLCEAVSTKMTECLENVNEKFLAK